MSLKKTNKKQRNKRYKIHPINPTKQSETIENNSKEIAAENHSSDEDKTEAAFDQLATDTTKNLQSKHPTFGNLYNLKKKLTCQTIITSAIFFTISLVGGAMISTEHSNQSHLRLEEVNTWQSLITTKANKMITMITLANQIEASEKEIVVPQTERYLPLMKMISTSMIC